MSGADNVDFNTLERALSSDVDNLQSMQARFMADILSALTATKGVSSGFGVPTSSVRDSILGGLIASVSATVNSIDISAGALVQNSATISPVPTALDSNFRMAINRAVTTLAAPAPGGNTYYLLEAQMVNVITSTVNRDIFNPGTGLFVSTPVTKLQERQVQFQFTAGSASAAPAPSANWVPIAIVFRAAGGGAVTADDIIDVRPLWFPQTASEEASAHATVGSYYLETDSTYDATAGNLVTFDFEACVNGRRLFAKATSADLGAAGILENGLALQANRLYYIYLAPWRGAYLPTNAYSGIAHRGVLIVSRVAPNRQSTNSATITPAAPFGGAAIAIGDAVCVGCLQQNAAANAYQAQRCSRSGLALVDYNSTTAFATVFSGAGTTAVNMDTNNTGGTEGVPFNAKALSLAWSPTAVPPGADRFYFQVRESGSIDTIARAASAIEGGAEVGYAELTFPLPPRSIDIVLAGTFTAGATRLVPSSWQY